MQNKLRTQASLHMFKLTGKAIMLDLKEMSKRNEPRAENMKSVMSRLYLLAFKLLGKWIGINYVFILISFWRITSPSGKPRHFPISYSGSPALQGITIFHRLPIQLRLSHYQHPVLKRVQPTTFSPKKKVRRPVLTLPVSSDRSLNLSCKDVRQSP